MPRAFGVVTALVVMAGTLLVAHPAEAAGDTYSWVGNPAPGPDDFSDPANWEHGPGADPGMPGANDWADISDPVDPVIVSEDTEVNVLTLRAPVDGQLDLQVGGASASLTAPGLVSLVGDVDLRDITTHDLQLTGNVTATADGVHIVPSAGGGPASISFDGVTSSSIFDLDDGPVDVLVVGEDPSVVEALIVHDSTLDLSGDDGGSFEGTVFASGDTMIEGDIPTDAIVEAGFDEDDPATVSWDEPSAMLDGLLATGVGVTTLSLPDALTVNGILGIDGEATGGSVDLHAGGGLRFVDQRPESHGHPNLDLTGALTSAGSPPAQIYVEPTDDACVGDEDLLVRAPGGLSYPSGTIGNDSSIPLTIDGLTLGDELVAVYRGSTDPSGCDSGASTRVARSMYRDLLGRRADARGAAYWAAKLDASAVAVASSLLATREARANLVAQTWAVWSCADEPPSDDQLADGVAFLEAGGTLARLRGEVLASTVPDDGDPVVCLYHAVLGREPDSGGRTYAEGKLEHESLQKLARRYMVTSEGRRVQFNRLYQRLLGRDATPEEVTAGTAAVRRGHPETWVTARVSGSDEYATRAAG